jgi:hypothetical protein
MITPLIHRSTLLAAALALSSCATSPSGRVDAPTEQALRAMSDKLAAAKTLRFTATRTASPGIEIGVQIPESARITGVVKRPSKLAAQARTNVGNRSIFYDGNAVTFVDHTGGTHATVPAGSSIDDTVTSIERTYHCKPPLADLLTNDPYRHLLTGVKKGTHLGQQTIGGKVCDHLSFQQDGLAWELWVGVSDRLPRQMTISYPNGEGGPPLTMTALIQSWQLDAPVADSEFYAVVPRGSRKVDMLPMQH